MAELPDLLNPKEAAAYLRLSVQGMKKWREQGKGPKWIKLGDGSTSPIRYPVESLAEFLESCTVK
jgi:Helix-turn-helix domain